MLIYETTIFEQAALRKPYFSWCPWRMRKSGHIWRSRQANGVCTAGVVELRSLKSVITITFKRSEGAAVYLSNRHGIPVVVTLGQKSWARPILESSRSSQKCTGKDKAITGQKRHDIYLSFWKKKYFSVVTCWNLWLFSVYLCDTCCSKDVSSTVFARKRICVYFTLYMFILQHFRGRKNRCYSLAVRAVRRAFVYATKARRLKKRNMRTVRYSI